jgi:glycosyltransferase involved in cell wall biosynthesis
MNSTPEKEDLTAKPFISSVQDASRSQQWPATDRSYAAWVGQFDTIGQRERIVIRRQLRALRQHPLISIVLPVFNPDLAQLSAAIESVRAQLYENWQLCIADDASTDSAVAPLLRERAASDSRIDVVFRNENGQIAACSNSALTLARGEWVAFLDQDDLLAPHALAFVVAEMEQRPDVALIYSDEDKIDEHGARTEPYFKSDWNPELFRVQNFINHLVVYRHSLLRDIGGLRDGFDGSQDYDLLLRYIEKLRAEQIHHVPRVLYHWRKSAGSIAGRPEAKSYAHESARRALREFLARAEIAARVEPCPEDTAAHRVAYEMPAEVPSVSVVIPTRDQPELLRRCIDRLRGQTDYANFEIVIVDNGSTEPQTTALLKQLAGHPEIRVVRDEGPFNFSRLINFGVRHARGPIIALLNDDIEVEDPDWLREMVSQLLQKDVGGVGARLWYPTNTIQHGGIILICGVAAHSHWYLPRGAHGYFNRAILQQNFSAVTGACLIVRKQLFEELGGFDEQNLAVSFNDVDFCLRVGRRGLRIVWTPYANLWHHESASRGRQRTAEEHARFMRETHFIQEKWTALLLRDPYYNPNLTAQAFDFSLAWPPRLPPLSQGVRPNMSLAL